MKLKAAINQLDHSNDEHWTQDGSPRVDFIAGLMQNNNITRQVITSAYPDLVRKDPRDGEDNKDNEGESGQDELGSEVLQDKPEESQPEIEDEKPQDWAERKQHLKECQDECCSQIAEIEDRISKDSARLKTLNFEHSERQTELQLNGEPEMNAAQAIQSFQKASSKTQAAKSLIAASGPALQVRQNAQVKPVLPPHLRDR